MGKHSKILEIICFPGSIFSVCEQHGDLRAIPRITCPRKPSFKSKWPKSQPTARVATGPPGRAPPGQAPRCPRHGCPGGRPQRRGGGRAARGRRLQGSPLRTPTPLVASAWEGKRGLPPPRRDASPDGARGLEAPPKSPLRRERGPGGGLSPAGARSSPGR